MSDDRLKKGDVVKLKSSSAQMTVSYENQSGSLGCRWWNTLTQKFETEQFNPWELKKCGSDSGSARGE